MLCHSCFQYALSSKVHAFSEIHTHIDPCAYCFSLRFIKVAPQQSVLFQNYHSEVCLGSSVLSNTQISQYPPLHVSNFLREMITFCIVLASANSRPGVSSASQQLPSKYKVLNLISGTKYFFKAANS